MTKAHTVNTEQGSFIKSFSVWSENEARNKPRDVCAGLMKGDPVVGSGVCSKSVPKQNLPRGRHYNHI